MKPDIRRQMVEVKWVDSVVIKRSKSPNMKSMPLRSSGERDKMVPRAVDVGADILNGHESAAHILKEGAHRR